MFRTPQYQIAQTVGVTDDTVMADIRFLEEQSANRALDDIATLKAQALVRL